MLTDKGEV